MLTGNYTRTLTDAEIGPAVKKRRLEKGASFASQSLQSDPSFADVLERLKKEEGTNATGMLVENLKHTVGV
jgi:DNA polymerase delta subunit 1